MGEKTAPAISPTLGAQRGGRGTRNLLGAPAPRPGTPDETADPERGGSKRCRNQRLLASGYEFRYPTFREGYSAVFAEQV